MDMQMGYDFKNIGIVSKNYGITHKMDALP